MNNNLATQTPTFGYNGKGKKKKNPGLLVKGICNLINCFKAKEQRYIGKLYFFAAAGAHHVNQEEAHSKRLGPLN